MSKLANAHRPSPESPGAATPIFAHAIPRAALAAAIAQALGCAQQESPPEPAQQAMASISSSTPKTTEKPPLPPYYKAVCTVRAKPFQYPVVLPDFYLPSNLREEDALKRAKEDARNEAIHSGIKAEDISQSDCTLKLISE